MEVEPFQGFVTIACCEQKQTAEEDATVGRETLTAAFINLYRTADSKPLAPLLPDQQH